MYTGSLIESLMAMVVAAEKVTANSSTFRVDVLDKSPGTRVLEMPREDDRVSD